jgi:(2Fe-2S) ferredoxin
VPKPVRHFFVCTNRRDADSGMPSCGPQGSREVLQGLLTARMRLGLAAEIFITQSLCLGPCPAEGATVVVYPEGVWYTGVTLADVDELAAKHMAAGEIVERLRDPNWG